MSGRGNLTERDYERKIRNLLGYTSQEARAMALRLLEAARRDRKVSASQLQHLESLFGPERHNDWFRKGRKGTGEPAAQPA